MPYQNVTMAPMDSPALDRRAWPHGSTLDHWLLPDGWPLRRFRMGSGERGRMLVIGGRADMIEKYIEPVSHWAAQGWAVTTFDWRGQGGSGRMTDSPVVGHFGNFSRWIDDLAALYAAWRAQGNGPAVTVGHSMGGHLLLRALVESAIDPDAAVLTAPMFGLNSGPIPECIALRVANAFCALGMAEKPAWKEGPDSPMRMSRLTHSAERFADDLWWRETTPDISLGAPSWRWIAEAYRSTRALERSRGIEATRTPTFIIGTDADKLVSPAAIRRIAARLPLAQLHMYDQEAEHEILREVDSVRLDAMARIDAFLDEWAPVE